MREEERERERDREIKRERDGLRVFLSVREKGLECKCVCVDDIIWDHKTVGNANSVP